MYKPELHATDQPPLCVLPRYPKGSTATHLLSFLVQSKALALRCFDVSVNMTRKKSNRVHIEKPQAYAQLRAARRSSGQSKVPLVEPASCVAPRTGDQETLRGR